MKGKEFKEFLAANGLKDATINNYMTYVRHAEESLGLSAEEIVAEDENMDSAVSKLPQLLEVKHDCVSSYLCGLKKYYFFANNEKYSGEKVSSKIKNWYQEVVVDEVDNLFRFINKLNDSVQDSIEPRKWAFRGQGDALWGLETSLGRVARYGEEKCLTADELILFEKESMWTFSREASKYSENRGFDGVNLLALMQHYGCKTRLLDFSMSPYIALFMALAQNEDDYKKVESYLKCHQKKMGQLKRPDITLWAVNLDALMSIEKNGRGTRNVADEFREADNMVKSGERYDNGVKIVFPSLCNMRISAQDGLFLMPRNLGESFEANLRTSISACEGYVQDGVLPESLTDIKDAGEFCPVIKFVFQGESSNCDVRKLLDAANITARTVYPDLTGLGRYVSDVIANHKC